MRVTHGWEFVVVPVTRQLLLETVQLSPGEEWTAEFPGWCFFQLQQGQGYWLGPRSRRELDEGMLGALSPLRNGYFLSSRTSCAVLKYFRLCPDSWVGLFTVAERILFESLASARECSERILPAGHPAAGLFRRLNEPEANPLQLRSTMIEVVACMFASELNSLKASESSVPTAACRVTALLNQIPDSELLTTSLPELAERCRCSVRHFGRVFKEAFGVSLRKKQAEIRLSKARNLLEVPGARIEAVSREAGYRSKEEFETQFIKHFGQTPEAWSSAIHSVSPGRVIPRVARANQSVPGETLTRRQRDGLKMNPHVSNGTHAVTRT